MTHTAPEILALALQIVPAIVLPYTTFDPEQLRFSKRKIGLIHFLYFLLTFSSFDFALRNVSISLDILTSIWFFIPVLIAFTFYLLIVQTSFRKKFITYSVPIFYLCTVFLIRAIFSYWFPALISTKFSFREVMILVMIDVILMPVCYYFNHSVFRKFISYFSNEDMKNNVYIASFFLWIYFLLIADYLYILRDSKSLYPTLFPLFLMIILLLFVLFWLLFAESIRYQKEKQDKILQENRVLQYKRLSSEIRRAQDEFHFLFHQFNTIYAYAENNETEKIISFIDDLQLHKTPLLQVYCENDTANQIFQYFFSITKQEQIQVELKAEFPSHIMTEDDITILLGNLLENAVSECRHLPQDQRWIHLRCEMNGSNLAIICSNGCQDVNKSESFIPSKTWHVAKAFSSTRYGDNYGLKAIEDIAGKYHGIASFKFDETDHSFTSRILLQLKSS